MMSRSEFVKSILFNIKLICRWFILFLTLNREAKENVDYSNYLSKKYNSQSEILNII